jgi:metal-responsive CopG/Arc/MetJ family transcriptional regulator
MAKVMISLPDELLEETDRMAAAAGKTRSGFIQESLSSRVQADRTSALAALEDLFSSAEPRGGDTVAFIKQMREEHTDKIMRRSR